MDWKGNSEKEIFDNIAKKLNLKYPRDWGDITLEALEDPRAMKIVKKYGNSLRNCLRAIYPSIYIDSSNG